MKKDVKNTDYVTKDYEGFRNGMISKIPEYAPEWTDHSQSDLGITLIELLAWGLDVLSMYQDKISNDSMLDTTTSRKSVIAHCRSLGYELSPQTPTQFKLTFKKQDDYIDSNILIPKGYKVGTDIDNGEQVIFETNEDLVITAGQKDGKVVATHGVTASNDMLGYSDGGKDQSFKLSFPDVLTDTLEVYVTLNGFTKKWRRVDDFLNSTRDSLHFVTRSNEFNETFVIFGNGISGKIPDNLSSISATYRVGGGKIGNVGINTITEFIDLDIVGLESVNNPEQPIFFGTDVESIEHAKVTAPKTVRANGRAVTIQDFEDLTYLYPSVLKAKGKETFNLNNDVLIYVLTESLQPVSEEFKKELKEHLESKAIANINVIIKDLEIVTLNLDIQPIVYSNYSNAEIEAKISQNISSKFAIEYMECGEGIPLARIMSECIKVEGVQNVIIKSPSKDVDVTSTQIIKIGDLNIKAAGGVDVDV